MSRHDRGDDLLDRGAVQCVESLQLANEAKFETNKQTDKHTYKLRLLVQFQQLAARLAADGYDAGMTTDMEEKEDVKEMVAEVVEWILSGTAANESPLSETRRDGNVQAEELVPGQGMIRQEDGTEAVSNSME